MILMIKPEIKDKLVELYEALDEIQETDYAQDTDDGSDDTFIWNIGEAMGYIDNAIDMLEED
jgi:hypothetical protein